MAIGFVLPPLIVPILNQGEIKNNSSLLISNQEINNFNLTKYHMMILLYFSAAFATVPLVLIVFCKFCFKKRF